MTERNGFHPAHAHAHVGVASESSTGKVPDQEDALQQWPDMRSWQKRSQQPHRPLERKANR